MEVIVMEGVGAGAEHGGEAPASAEEDLAQESALVFLATPAAPNRDVAPIGEGEGHDIHRIAECVLGERCTAPAVARAAGVIATAHCHDTRAEIQRGCRLHDLFEPALGLGDDGAAQRGRIGELDRARRSGR